MRIISGTYKGRRINPPKGLPVRPTTDMAKEALFNILHNRYFFEEISVLDLFAGTGNISFEFASRGVPEIVAVDEELRCVRFISEVTKAFDFPIQVIKKEVFNYLTTARRSFDIIFADPPYGLSDADFSRISELSFNSGMVIDDGVLIIEHSRHTDLSGLPGFSWQRKYGGSVFSFFEQSDQNH